MPPVENGEIKDPDPEHPITDRPSAGVGLDLPEAGEAREAGPASGIFSGRSGDRDAGAAAHAGHAHHTGTAPSFVTQGAAQPPADLADLALSWAPAAGPSEDQEQPLNTAQGGDTRTASAPPSASRDTVLPQGIAEASGNAPVPRELAFAARLTANGELTASEPNVSATGVRIPVEPAVSGQPGAGAAASSSEPEGQAKERTADRSAQPAVSAGGIEGAELPAGAPHAIPLSAQPAHAAPRAASSERVGAAPELPVAAQALERAEPPLLNPRIAGPVRNIALRLAADQQRGVEVRIIERGGEVRVAVRSADAETAQSMRAGLSELAEQLGARGFNTEIWRPQPAGPLTRTGSESAFGRESRDGGGSNPGHQPGHQQRDERQPAWLDELESSFTSHQTLNRSTLA